MAGGRELDLEMDEGTLQNWVQLLYEELRRMAHRERARLFGGETLVTTALINEAYARLAAAHHFKSRGDFLRIAATVMRRVLVDRVRTQFADKRGGGEQALPLDDADGFVVEGGDEVLGVHEALAGLAELNPRLAQVVECRFFAGYDEAQTADALGISERTVQRDWVTARAWLKKELQG